LFHYYIKLYVVIYFKIRKSNKMSTNNAKQIILKSLKDDIDDLP